MIRYALTIVCGDAAKLLGLVSGLAFAALLITQQAGIYLGLMDQTGSFIDDFAQGDIWVMDPRVRASPDVFQLPERELFRVRGIDGVAWAAPLAHHLLSVDLPGGRFRLCEVVGIDPVTARGSSRLVNASALDALQEPDAVLVAADAAAIDGALARRDDGIRRALTVGDTLRINDRRAVLAGTVRARRGFFWSPLIITTYERAQALAGTRQRTMGHIQVKAAPGVDPAALARTITARTGLAAYTNQDFRLLCADFVLHQTPLLTNFGSAILIGFIVGTAIAGQAFHQFVLDNLRQLAAFKAMGAGNGHLLGMLLVQALFVGGIGYGIGVGMAALIGDLLGDKLAFRLDPRLLLTTAVAIGLICSLAALSGVFRVMRLQPATVFRA